MLFEIDLYFIRTQTFTCVFHTSLCWINTQCFSLVANDKQNKWKCLMIRRQSLENSDLVYSSFHILVWHSYTFSSGLPVLSESLRVTSKESHGATGFGWCSQRGLPRWWLGTRWQHMEGTDRSYVIVSHCRCKGQDVNQIQYQNSHQFRQISVPFL